jgi:hypothetical protein
MLCKLLSTKEKRLDWDHNASIDKDIYGEIKFTLNEKPAFSWHIVHLHYYIEPLNYPPEDTVSDFREIFENQLISSNTDSAFMLLPWFHKNREVSTEGKIGINLLDLILSKPFSEFSTKEKFINLIVKNKIPFNLNKAENVIYDQADDSSSKWESFMTGLVLNNEEYCFETAKNNKKAMETLINLFETPTKLQNFLLKGKKNLIEKVLKFPHLPKKMGLDQCISGIIFFFNEKVAPESLEFFKPHCSHVDFTENSDLWGRDRYEDFFMPQFKNYWEYLIKLFPSIINSDDVQNAIKKRSK